MIPFRIEEVELSEMLEYYLTAVQYLDAFPGSVDGHIVRLATKVAAIGSIQPRVA